MCVIFMHFLFLSRSLPLLTSFCLILLSIYFPKDFFIFSHLAEEIFNEKKNVWIFNVIVDVGNSRNFFFFCSLVRCLQPDYKFELKRGRFALANIVKKKKIILYRFQNHIIFGLCELSIHYFIVACFYLFSLTSFALFFCLSSPFLRVFGKYNVVIVFFYWEA